MTRPNGPASQQSGPYKILGDAPYFARSRSEIEVRWKICPGNCRGKTIGRSRPRPGQKDSDQWIQIVPSDLSKSGAIKKITDGFTYIDPTQFHEFFAADLSAEQAAFMARSQVPNLTDNFKAVITTAAWRSKPSWALVAGADKTINPDLERWYATRANSHKVEVSVRTMPNWITSERAASHAR